MIRDRSCGAGWDGRYSSRLRLLLMQVNNRRALDRSAAIGSGFRLLLGVIDRIFGGSGWGIHLVP